MLYLNKEEYMESLGTSEIEQKDLVPLTFETFINLKEGDTVYLVNDWEYFIKVPYIVIYSKFLKSPLGCCDRHGKRFYYKQILLKREFERKWADSAGSNYKNLYVRTSMFQILLNRQKTRKKEKRYGKKHTKNNKVNEKRT